MHAALAGGVPPRLANGAPSDEQLAAAIAWADEEIERHRSAGVEAIGFFDARYPQRLSDIPDPPPVIFARGNLDLSAHPKLVAVVGTRAPSTFGETAVREIVRTVAKDGWGVVSGLALDIDTLAHREALASNAPTIAILGNGLDHVYPKGNEHLADEVVADGRLLLSELPFGAPPIPRNLIARDRIQSGISAAVVVIQSGIKGGAMHTARFAAEQARPLFCPVPHGENGKSEGLRVLLEQPADELWNGRVNCGMGGRRVTRPLPVRTPRQM